MPHTQARPVSTETIIRKPLLTAHIENTKLVERVEIKQLEFQPNQQTGLHLHPCPTVGIIVKGSILFQIEGQLAKLLKSGDAFFEPANTNIIRFDAQEEGAIFIVYYLLGPGEYELITMLDDC